MEAFITRRQPATGQPKQGAALRRHRLVPLLARQCGPGRFHAEGSLLRVAWTLADTTRGEDGPGRAGEGHVASVHCGSVSPE